VVPVIPPTSTDVDSVAVTEPDEDVGVVLVVPELGTTKSVVEFVHMG